MIKEYDHVPWQRVANSIVVSLHRVQEIIADLGYRMVWMRWVPRQFTEELKQECRNLATALIEVWTWRRRDFVQLCTRNGSWQRDVKPARRGHSGKYHTRVLQYQKISRSHLLLAESLSLLSDALILQYIRN
jgi:hypothetical protein